MSHSRLFTTILLTFLLTATQSCISDITIEQDDDLPLVVECVLHKTKTQELKLYRMPSIYGKGEQQPIEDAQITLQTATNGWGTAFEDVATFHRVDDIHWAADYEPKYGKMYKLQIITSDLDTLTAKTIFPLDQRLVYCARELIDKSIPITGGGPGIYTTYAMCSYEVREGKYKYYNGDEENVSNLQYKDYRDPSDKPCKIWIFPRTNATPIDSTVLNNPYEMFGSIQYSRDIVVHYDAYNYKGAAYPYGNLICTDHPFVDNFNLTEGTVSNLEWCNQPINTQGWFHDFPVPNSSQWIKFFNRDLPLHDSFIRIDQPANFSRKWSQEQLEDSYLITDRSFVIFADYDPDSYWNVRSCTNEVHFVSAEYDEYLRDLYIRKGRISNFILSVYDMTEVYTNVIGGKGIFGADNITWDMTNLDYSRVFGIPKTNYSNKAIIIGSPEERH